MKFLFLTRIIVVFILLLLLGSVEEQVAAAQLVGGLLSSVVVRRGAEAAGRGVLHVVCLRRVLRDHLEGKQSEDEVLKELKEQSEV